MIRLSSLFAIRRWPLLALIALTLLLTQTAQATDPGWGWTWADGPDTIDGAGKYGKEDVPASSNTPGARYEAASWTDSAGQLWLFGGLGYDSDGVSGRLNDLWKYDPVEQKWTWVDGATLTEQSGIYGTEDAADPANVPGARTDSAAWIDSSDRLWLFGGTGFDSAGAAGDLNDLWTFDPVSGQWTWVDGSTTVNQSGTHGTEDVAAPANVPGARSGAVAWIDSSDRLWLFGGNGYDGAGSSNRLNDLWRFNPASGQWTWVDGSTTGGQWGTYGTEDTPAPGNVPGARRDPVSWIDSGDQLWLFGGLGRDSAGSELWLNDLWSFDPTSGEWTWVDGSTTISENGVYGTEDVGAVSNVPGARESSVTWIDDQDRLWLFGGFGRDSAGTTSRLNDLWRFNPATGRWLWADGADVVRQPGIYGKEDVPNGANTPGARYNAASWLDGAGQLWVFGGDGYDGEGMSGRLNDLWRFELPAAPLLKKPTDGDDKDKPPTLSWKKVSGAVNYLIEADNDSDFSSPEIDNDSDGKTKYKPVEPLSYGLYYWRVQADLEAGLLSALSDEWTFYVTLLNKPKQLSITTDTTPTFKWKKDKALVPATSYRLCYDTDANPLDGTCETPIEGTSFTPLTPITAVDATITWSIEILDGDNAGQVMPVWEFQIDLP